MDQRAIILEAGKYTSRVEFSKGSPKAYEAARKRPGFFKEICSHMGRGVTHKVEFSEEQLAKIALNFSSRSEFKKYKFTAYERCKELNIFEKVCSHMKHRNTSSLPEKELFKIIKKNYECVKNVKWKFKNVIKDKPYIKGFEIDIYIPSIGKGIEFDGTYWHSFDKMRADKRKKNWPDADIKNYHDIKDEYFLSQGIKILHIKEEDWIKNKDLQIQKCLEFLKT